MADRTSAGIFGTVFEYLAKEPITKEAREMAHWLWGQQGQYDYSYYQLCCDDALTKLGLCRRGVDPEYPDDGETTLYGPEE